MNGDRLIPPKRIGIFTHSAVGYVENPEALYSRAIAWGLHERGHQVRMLEERRNPSLRKTLEVVGSGASRHVYEAFSGVLIHSYEPKRGAPLMEWLARELSLVDLAIAIDGLSVETARWIANLSHPDTRRAFLTYRPGELTPARAAEIEIERYDAVLASSAPAVNIAWLPIKKSIAPQDRSAIPPEHMPALIAGEEAEPGAVARSIESLLAE